MSFYSNNILPRLLDWSMSGSIFSQYREQVLADVRGEVLEIGFGTGLNLAFYPKDIQKITTVDPNRGMNALAQKRINSASITVDCRILNGENLPMADCIFDSVVSTWTLCSIAKIEQALQEIYRLLKPNGRFFFIEHGLSSDRKIQVWQHRLTPIQKIIGDGCHLDRNMRELIQQQFATLTLKEFEVEGLPKVGGYFYQGIATKN